MEQVVLHLAHAAVWTFGILFVLAIVGVIAIVRWISEPVFPSGAGRADLRGRRGATGEQALIGRQITPL